MGMELLMTEPTITVNAADVRTVVMFGADWVAAADRLRDALAAAIPPPDEEEA